MPQSLKGYSILIGREPGNSRLTVVLEGNGVKKFGFIEQPGTVPDTVSRCIPEQSKAHAAITIDNDGDMVIKNLKPNNTTFVDGVQILSKHIDTRSRIGLGPTNFAVDLGKILMAAKKLSPQKAQMPGGSGSGKEQQAPTYSIRHLERVWEERDRGMRKLQEDQRKLNLKRTGFGMFTMMTMPLLALGVGEIAYVCTGLGIVGNIYSFVGMKNINTYDAQQAITKNFQKTCRCPNPKCNKYLGSYPSYELLKDQTSMKCPYCKCNFIE